MEKKIEVINKILFILFYFMLFDIQEEKVMKY